MSLYNTQVEKCKTNLLAKLIHLYCINRFVNYGLCVHDSHNQTHGFGLKRATTAPPPAQHCRGRRGAFSAALKICFLLNNNVNYAQIKSTLKMKFSWTTPETKKFA
jgi:hypothetical protein